MFFAHLASPENNLKNQQDRQGANSPKKRPVQKTRVLFVRHFRQAVDKSFQLFVGPGLGYQSDQHGDNDAGDAGLQRLVHGLGKSLRIR